MRQKKRRRPGHVTRRLRYFRPRIALKPHQRKHRSHTHSNKRAGVSICHWSPEDGSVNVHPKVCGRIFYSTKPLLKPQPLSRLFVPVGHYPLLQLRDYRQHGTASCSNVDPAPRGTERCASAPPPSPHRPTDLETLYWVNGVNGVNRLNALSR